jgi:DNA-directed RNA polymerase specialized sigma24 family protein
VTVKAVPAGVARGGFMPEGRWYRYRGRQDWPPAVPPEDLSPKLSAAARGAVSAARIAEAEARREKFAGYRDEGLSVQEAAELTGVNVSTGRKYEARRRGAGSAQ